MAKVYGLDYWAEKIERRNKKTLRNKENEIIKTMTKNINALDTHKYYYANEKKKKMLKAKAYSVPLTGWLK